MTNSVKGKFTTIGDKRFYVIENYKRMQPFFMALASGSDIWCFLSTEGGLTAGRKNSDNAIFPYYTEDKIRDNSENTGSISVIRDIESGKTWIPFFSRNRDIYELTYNLYKAADNTAIYFEAINHDMMLSFMYGYTTSDKYGLVKHSIIKNLADGKRKLDILDGLQNLLPAAVTAQTQNEFSCLLDAYKKSELELPCLGIYSLSSILTDRAEPSEALIATSCFTTMEPDKILISADQIEDFIKNSELSTETDIRGKRCAYIAEKKITLDDTADWYFAVDINMTHSDIVELLDELSDINDIEEKLKENIKETQQELVNIVAMSDGIQIGNDEKSTSHHYANTLYNVMRGGIFMDGYMIDTEAFAEYVKIHNKKAYSEYKDFLYNLPGQVSRTELIEKVKSLNSKIMHRLASGYLPLSFSRRHGDPSRPWNRFSIEIKDKKGKQIKNYQGNWRDIFQNWEALSLSYPEYTEAFIHTFINATTADGYNPYRISYSGIDWEVPEPDNPWSNIGYWGDHQIIYLLKLLEWYEKYNPGKLKETLNSSIFTHANVPYRIKPYAEILKNPQDTIIFDWEVHKKATEKRTELGSDGLLVLDKDNNPVTVTLAEKLLLLALTKLGNLIPGGGIWMNTQRPEWNDANNALVGAGLSVVTLAYLRRYLVFLKDLFKKENTQYKLTYELATFLNRMREVFTTYEPEIAKQEKERALFMQLAGTAGEHYRNSVYKGITGEQSIIKTEEILELIDSALKHVESSLRANKREDGLYHSYNLLITGDNTAKIRHLYPMLEGQVAILSSGMLSVEESIEVLTALRNSKLYREDQHSYLLYPDRQLPRFMQKNKIDTEEIKQIPIIQKMLKNGDTRLIEIDKKGQAHFNHKFRNAECMEEAFKEIIKEEQYKEHSLDITKLKEIYEKTFDHKSFTGRSGTFFAYEGLGSIYWHMVSKLLLAVQEIYQKAKEEEKSTLAEIYHDIRAGLGFSKEPQTYGAFPTEPYSHTPAHKGAQQPGMTGQVKEELLTRAGELGITIENRQLAFSPTLLPQKELLEKEKTAKLKTTTDTQEITIPQGGFAFTLCGTPIIYTPGEKAQITIEHSDSNTTTINSNILDTETSSNIFMRSKKIKKITCTIDTKKLYKK